MGFFFTRLIRYAILLLFLHTAVQYYLRWKSYHISPKVFRSAATPSEIMNGLSNTNKLRNELKRTYDSSIREVGWEPMYGGGLDLKVKLLYAAPTEFVAVLHAPYRTSGFSGWHWSNFTCTVLNGQVDRSALLAHGASKETFSPGSNFRNGEHERFSYELSPDTFVACYARGAILFSTIWIGTGALAKGDPISFARIVFDYTSLCVVEIGESIVKTYHHYKTRLLSSQSL